MNFVVSFVSLLFLVSAHKEDWEQPWFCHGLDCPIYSNPTNLTYDNTVIEIRKYESCLWVSTNVVNNSLDDALDVGFNRLFDYISGANVAKESIDMTSPVKTYIPVTQGPFCDTNFTISFYVPYAYQPPNNAPPKPTDPTVYVDTMAAVTVAVKSFGGYDEDKTVIGEAELLANDLNALGVKYDENAWTYAGYDPPFRVTGRHNEVWFQVYGY